jgi:hypothetical protein
MHSHAEIAAVLIEKLVKSQEIASVFFADDFKSRLLLDGSLIGKTPAGKNSESAREFYERRGRAKP